METIDILQIRERAPRSKVRSYAILGWTLFVLALVANGCSSPTSPAKSGQWTQVFEGGGIIETFVVSGTTICAGTDAGIFFSTNDGVSWTPSAGQPNGYIQAFAANGGYLFAATDGGVFRSSDNGRSWTTTNSNWYNTAFTAIASEGQNVFAGTDTGGHVFCSTDNGATWNAGRSSGLSPLGTVVALTVLGPYLFAANFAGVSRSTDHGSSWVATSLQYTATCFAVSGSKLFVGTTLNNVFRSTDSGATWTSASGNLRFGYGRAMASSGKTLFAGDGPNVFVSSDDGNQWTTANTGLADVAITAMSASGTSLFIGTITGTIWKSPLAALIE